MLDEKEAGLLVREQAVELAEELQQVGVHMDSAQAICWVVPHMPLLASYFILPSFQVFFCASSQQHTKTSWLCAWQALFRAFYSSRNSTSCFQPAAAGRIFSACFFKIADSTPALAFLQAHKCVCEPTKWTAVTGLHGLGTHTLP